MVDTCDVLVVGAGPAGLSAAYTSALAGADVLLVDDNPKVGGQIWRHPSSNLPKWTAELETLPIRIKGNTRVLGAAGDSSVLVETGVRRAKITYKSLILATGASERFLPFPGWTLPNVFGAGGLQALAKSGLDLKTKRVVVAGTGPLLLAVAAHLVERGAKVSAVVEQASLQHLLRHAPRLLGSVSKLTQAIGLRSKLSRTPIVSNSYVVRAEGDGYLERVLVRTRRGDRWIDCDYLAVGFHLLPNTELAEALGCAIGLRGIVVGDGQETTVRNVYAAGECTGVAGVRKAEHEGVVAALSATQRVETGARYHVKTDRAFGEALDRAFALRPELLDLAETDTIVCRCEDVRMRDLEPYGSWREAKLQTRCGMGPCQGRVCGPILEAIKGWKRESVRPPVVACRVGSLIGEESEE